MVMFVIFASVLVLMLLGVTTAVTMGFASAATFLLAGGDMARLFLVPQRMFAQVSGITLMSIPFFLLMGNLMTEGGVSKSLFAFGRVSLGHRWGGLSNAAIAACIVMAAMSGSAAACAAGIGMIAVAEMKKSGYGEAFSCATIAAGGALGPIIPPSITLILYAGLTQTSVNALFAAGAVPGLIIGFAFMLWSSCVCRMKGYAKTQAAPWRERWYAFKEAFFALLTPVIVIGGMFAGLFTATEAAAVASFYVMILGFFVFKTLKVKDLPKIFWATAEQTAKVMFVIATAGFFQYVLLYTRIPQEAIAFISTSFTSIVPVLLIIIALLVIMGCFMEGTAILLITVPIFVPLAKAFGFDVVQLGIVMCISLAVGVLNLYVMASISGVKVMAIAREALGYVLIMILGAAAVAFIPELSLGLVRLVP
ncbi:TRAP transporter large permease [Duodenibacillus massiliensis]|uniref:TRAP transporter large permease n=1 Tax=Duodenibacillus massiliensis TaxID=1852381 RepID=UPI003076C2A2